MMAIPQRLMAHKLTFSAATATLAAIVMVATPLHAKPIAFADATTFMHERDGNMLQTELFYAPKHWWSIGLARSQMQSDDNLRQMETSYLQVNFLVKRWNLPGAQGNLFASAGYGYAHSVKEEVAGIAHPGHLLSQRAEYSENANRLSVQGDYETRQIYTSFKVDTHRTPQFYERIDTLQVGFSPVAHDYDDLAVWFIAQAKKYRGMNDKTEVGALVRFFRKNVWVEIGMTEQRRTQMMLMVNY
jgi:hypothetical protein